MICRRCVLPFVALMFVSCSGDDSPTSPVTGPTNPPVAGAGGSVILAQGQIQLPAATTTSGTGFHEFFSLVHLTPTTLQPTQGAVLVVSLADVSRPGQSCSEDHPLSGCATVDWSDATQVYDNRIVIPTDGGSTTFFLSETGFLANAPDQQSDT